MRTINELRNEVKSKKVLLTLRDKEIYKLKTIINNEKSAIEKLHKLLRFEINRQLKDIIIFSLAFFLFGLTLARVILFLN